MKKILTVILLIFVTFLTSGFTKIHNDKVLKVIQKQVPDDNFYFIRGLEREYVILVFVNLQWPLL